MRSNDVDARLSSNLAINAIRYNQQFSNSSYSIMIDEGYIKFNPTWLQQPLSSSINVTQLNVYRQKLYHLQLIGAYPNGIGYGNISQRLNAQNEFIISGSKTGNFPFLHQQHYAKVNTFDLAKNSLVCEGAILASSESMSHAVIYQECSWVNAVIHIHHVDMWKRLLYKVPTTNKSATYGTPEMANSIIDLLKTTELPEKRIFVMEGHEEGIFSFGASLGDAFKVLLAHF